MRGAVRTRGPTASGIGTGVLPKGRREGASPGSWCWCLVSPGQFEDRCRLRMVRSREWGQCPADQQGACIHIAVSLLICEEEVFLLLTDCFSDLPMSRMRCIAAAAPLQVESSDLPLGMWWPWVGGHSCVPVGSAGVCVSQHRAAERFSLG